MLPSSKNSSYDYVKSQPTTRSTRRTCSNDKLTKVTSTWPLAYCSAISTSSSTRHTWVLGFWHKRWLLLITAVCCTVITVRVIRLLLTSAKFVSVVKKRNRHARQRNGGEQKSWAATLKREGALTPGPHQARSCYACCTNSGAPGLGRYQLRATPRTGGISGDAPSCD